MGINIEIMGCEGGSVDGTKRRSDFWVRTRQGQEMIRTKNGRRTHAVEKNVSGCMG